jgi:hypothetical protein
MANRTRDELTKATQFGRASKAGGNCKMESGCGLRFAGRYSSFDCSDPLTLGPQLAYCNQCVRDAEGGLHLGRPLDRGAPTTTYYICTKGPQSQFPRKTP